MRTLWCFSSVATRPRIISMAVGFVGSSTLTTWKRRARAASFSKYFLYSAQVVAAMVRSSPRARAGLSRLAASPWPGLPAGADHGVGLVDEQDDRLRRGLDLVDHRLEAVLELALDAGPGLQQAQVERADGDVAQRGGTSPAAMRRAKPSTTAVLPTPASPVRIGLFCRRRVRMSMIWRISASRPSTGSISPLAGALREVDGELVERGRLGRAQPLARCRRPAAGSPAAAPVPRAASHDAAVMSGSSRRSDSDGDLLQLAETPRRSAAPACRRRARLAAGGPSGQRRAELDRGHHPGLLHQVDELRRQGGARALPVFSRSITAVRSRATREASISKWRKTAARSASGISQQLQQPVLDFDVVVGARQAQARRGFKAAAAGVVELADQRFQADVIHNHTFQEKTASDTSS